MQKKETTEILVSAKILPNKVYTNVKGYGFCFLAVGNNQSLKPAVERPGQTVLSYKGLMVSITSITSTKRRLTYQDTV